MPTTIPYVILDVFTTTPGHGNPLAVCRLAANTSLSQDQLQKIATDFNLSETVFLHEEQLDKTTSLSRDENDHSTHTPTYRVQIFTIESEISFAGHPTIGVSHYIFETFLAASGYEAQSIQNIKLHCPAGVIDVAKDIKLDNGEVDLLIQAEIPHNYRKHTEHTVSVETLRRLQPALNDEAIKKIDLVSPVNGMTFLTVQLASLEDLGNVAVTGVRPDSLISRDVGWQTGFLGTAYYVQTEKDCNRYRTRMIEGNFEDPATGSMSCALATLLALQGKVQRSDFWFEQAVEMSRPSHIRVMVDLDAELTTCEKITLSGQAVQVKEGTISV